jgi:hypothetical protein
VESPAGIPEGQGTKRWLRVRLASPTGPAHPEVSSNIMNMSFSAASATGERALHFLLTRP